VQCGPLANSARSASEKNLLSDAEELGFFEKQWAEVMGKTLLAPGLTPISCRVTVGYNFLAVRQIIRISVRTQYSIIPFFHSLDSL